MPKLRFPGFEGEWRTVRLSDFADRITRKNSQNESNLPLTISSKDGLVDQISYFNKTVASKDMSGYYLLLNGEFAYNKSYSVGFDFGSIKRLDRYPMGALSTLYICFSVKNYDSDFIKTYFDSLKWYKEIYKIAAEGARNHGLLNVPTEDFFTTRHTLPTNIKEQQKIAAFMNLLERRIEAQRRLVEALKSYKRGVLSHIFAIVSASAKLNKLGKLCNITTGKMDANASVQDGKYPFFTCGRKTLKINCFEFDGEAILIAGNGDIGHTKYFNGRFNAYQRTYVLTGFQERAHFLQCAIDYYLPNKIISEMQGGAMPYIKMETLTNLLIPVPTKDMQVFFETVIVLLNDILDAEEGKHNSLLHLKNALLQQLFI